MTQRIASSKSRLRGRGLVRLIALHSLLGLAGCADLSQVFAPRTQNLAMTEGPPIEDVISAFDEALICLQGKVPTGLAFAVGQVVDATGKESYSEGGSGKYISQGAGEMVQTALFRTGVTVVNRRDPNIAIVETQWGIRDLQAQIPVNFYISGSINSLDFIPGGGVSATIGGIGPRYRQSRILIGLDLTMTDAFTGKIVASMPLQKQIFSQEVGASAGRFFGETLVSLDAGGQQREAVHFALRQMLNLATFELLGQLVDAESLQTCQAGISPFFGAVRNRTNPNPAAVQEAIINARESRPRAAAAAPPQAQQQQQAQQAPAQGGQAPLSLDQQLTEIGRQASVLGARAIAAAEESLAAEEPDVAARKAAEAMQLVAKAAQYLQRGAEMGLEGPDGDAAAIVVERALTVSELAAKKVIEAQAKNEVKKKLSETAPSPTATPPATEAKPGSLEAERKPARP